MTEWILQIFRDVCCQREILALKVYCRCRASGCQEVMTLQQVPVGLVSSLWPSVCVSSVSLLRRPNECGILEVLWPLTSSLCGFSLQEHLNVCGFFEVPCPLAQCPERLLRKEVPDHLSWRCQQRQASCDYCQATMPLAQLQVGVTSLPVPDN